MNTLGTLNHDFGSGTSGFELYLRGLVGVNNTVDDLQGPAVTISGASGKRSASSMVPLINGGTRTPIIEFGFSTSNGGLQQRGAMAEKLIGIDSSYGNALDYYICFILCCTIQLVGLVLFKDNFLAGAFEGLCMY